MENKESLSRYGYSFQTKLIACILSDNIFISQVYDILKDEYFESDSIRWIIHKCFVYYNQYKRIPTLDVLKVYSDKVDDALVRQEIVNTLRDSIKSVGAADLDFVKDTTITFCRNQELKSAILQSIEYLKAEKYDNIRTVIDAAFKVGMSNDIGLDYLEDIDTRYIEDARKPIPTGWSVMNTLLKGGLSAGDVGMFIANSGVGKSWLLTHIGAHAVKEKMTVFHYTLELNQSYTGLRYDSILTGVPLDKLNLHKDSLEGVLKKLDGKLIIKWYPMKSVSLMGIKAHIDRAKMLGKNPDLVIIDYADLLKYTGKAEQDDKVLKELSEELKGFAGELQLPVWTVSQGNREGLDQDVLEADKISGAYSKMFAYDFVASLSRKRQDKISNTARMHIIKNRFGADGMTFPVTMDTNRGLIEVHDQLSEEGKQTNKRMQKDEQFTRENGKKRYLELINSDSVKKTTW